MTIIASNSLTVSSVNDGTITHVAYSYSADGTDRFTTTYPSLNLLDGTKDFSGFWDRADRGWENDGTHEGLTVKKRIWQWDGINKTFTAPKDGIYTFSAYVKSSGDSANITRYVEKNRTDYSGEWAYRVFENNFDWLRDSLTVTLKAKDTISVRYEITGSGSDSIVWTAGHKWEPGSTATPRMPSASEVTTADWPKYIGHYTDFTQADSTNPSDYTWGPMRGDDGKDGADGHDGIAGKDGNGIKTTVITYAISTNGATVPTSGWTSTVPTVATGSYLWTKTVWTYTDNTSETGYSVGKMGDTGPAGSDGNPGKIVSDTEPTTKFKGLAWKYSGAVDMTLGNGTKILAGTEYYWNGTAWALYEINAHNINGDNLSVTNGTFKDGKIESIWGGNGVNGTTTIEGSHLQIYSSNSTTNTENTVAIDNLQGYAQVYTDRNTGRAITVQASFQGFFVSDSTGPYVRVTPNGIKTSSDKSYNSFQIGAGITINLERRGDIVEATLSGSINSPLSSNTKFVVGTIPVGYRPNRLAYIMVHMTSSNNSSHIDVEPNGLCTWWGTSFNAGAPRGNQMWFTDDPLQN